MSRRAQSLLPFVFMVVLTACSGVNKDDEDDTLNKEQRREAKVGRLFGDDTLLFGGDDEADGAGAGIGVNHFLWRASLDTIAFMPLRSVDPFGGVIISEWYTPPESPKERFKVDIRILDRQLRADGVKVAIHKQRRNVKGEWLDSVIDSKSAGEFEEAILTRARQLKNNDNNA